MRFEKGCLNLGGPIAIEDGESADLGRLSRGGEEEKLSTGDIGPGGGREIPLPNLNAGHSTLADLRETEFVDTPFAREKDGLDSVSLRRLQGSDHQEAS